MSNCEKCGKRFGLFQAKYRHTNEFGNKINLCFACNHIVEVEENQRQMEKTKLENEKRLKIIKPIIKKYFDKCDVSKQISICSLYTDKESFGMVADDNLVEIENYIEEFRSFTSSEINSGNYNDLDSSMSFLKTCEEQLDFMIDLEKIYKLTHKKGISTNYPELLKLFNDLLDEDINEETKLILDHEYLRIAGKLYTNISVRNVIKELIKSPLDIFIDDDIAKQLLKRFNLDFNKEQINGLIEELQEEIDLEGFEQNLGENSNLKILSDPQNLSGLEFEAFLKQLFEILGYTVMQTKSSGDQGADLVIMLDNIKTAVQAKRYSGKVSNTAIQQVVASKKHYNCDKSMVVTTGKFTKSAIQLAISNDVELWDSEKLSKVISDINDATNLKPDEDANSFDNGTITKQSSINVKDDAFPSTCPICGKEVSLNVDKLPKVNEKSSFTCPECDFPFSISLEIEHYSCEHCHEQFESIRERITHIESCSVLKLKQCKCIHCNAELTLDNDEYKEYNKKGTLSTVCPVCNKTFVLKK